MIPTMSGFNILRRDHQYTMLHAVYDHQYTCYTVYERCLSYNVVAAGLVSGSRIVAHEEIPETIRGAIGRGGLYSTLNEHVEA